MGFARMNSLSVCFFHFYVSVKLVCSYYSCFVFEFFHLFTCFSTIPTFVDFPFPFFFFLKLVLDIHAITTFSRCLEKQLLSGFNGSIA